VMMVEIVITTRSSSKVNPDTKDFGVRVNPLLLFLEKIEERMYLK